MFNVQLSSSSWKYFFCLGDAPGSSVVYNCSGPWWSPAGDGVWGYFFMEL